MTDDELRKVVREAIARHLGSGGARTSHAGPDSVSVAPPWRSHASFAKFLNLPADNDAGPCLIEPSVACNHCGFCKSYGH